MEIKNSNFILVLAVILTITSVFSIGLFYLSARSFIGTFSGYAASTGEANLTVESDATIAFTTSQINWGSGRVNAGQSSAGLNTFETNNVTNGNWTLQAGGGLRIQNNGNVNLTLNLSGTKTAAQLVGGTGPSYRWNISNAETGSCPNSSGGTTSLPLDTFYDVNTSTALFCTFFHYDNTQDSIRIDFNITIPSDSSTGALGDTITATVFPAPY